MKILVTGCAGFIGSHLAEELAALGHDVIGIDCFTDYYRRSLKELNLAGLKTAGNFKFLEGDLNLLNLDEILNDIEVVFHQAAQAGVRASWGQNFAVYEQQNILATQKLLEAAKKSRIKKFVYASSSSIYGLARTFPIKEEHPAQPVSPYGVTKLAAENLVYLYWKNFGLPGISLRYFTVFGPRQRPDMAFTRFIKSVIKNEPFEIYGDGQQIRDFTFVKDAVAANISLLSIDNKLVAGQSFNIGGGHPVTVNEVIKIIEKSAGNPARPVYREFQKGDVLETRADTTKALKILSFKPRVALDEGINSQVSWLRKLLDSGAI